MNSKQITVGAAVTFTAEVQEMNSELAHAIFEIRDARVRSGGGYGFSLALVQDPPALNCVHFDVSEKSLRVVG